MNKNQKVVVSEQHPYWPGRIGYFYMSSKLGDNIICSVEPLQEVSEKPRNVFVVNRAMISVFENPV